ANALLARDLATLFVGIIIAFASVPLIVGLDAYLELFPAIDDTLAARLSAVAGRGLGRFDDILISNTRVLCACFLISLLFRYLGVLFVIIYNAATWGVTFTYLIAAHLSDGAHGVGWGSLLAALAVPHVILEVAAYVTACMAGVFTSKCLLRYRIGSNAFVHVASSILKTVLVSGLLLIAAAAWEAVVLGSVPSDDASAERLPHLHPHDGDHNPITNQPPAR
ncbi:MAG: stage II sporulation protein M, partial [Planctomycetota bacterium]